MTVEWREYIDLPEEFWESYDGSFPLHTDYKGEVINAVRSWGTTTLVVMCSDGKIREVAASRAAATIRAGKGQ